tara:strand:+ start:664 stop:936 length:273 start_codon:yes stop_codon:yes gene_type:complete
MYAEFTEIIKGGIEQGSTRKIVINLEKIISFRAVPHDGGTVLETRRDDIHVEQKYDEVKRLFNNKNGIAPVLLSTESWIENISNPVIDEN